MREPVSNYSETSKPYTFTNAIRQIAENKHVKIENLTGKPVTLFCSNGKNEEVQVCLMPKGRADIRRKKMYRSGKGSRLHLQGTDSSIPLFTAKPVEDLLGISEIVIDLPSVQTNETYYLVNAYVAYSLYRRGSKRIDILIPGKAVKDPSTGQIMGFENLTLFQFTGDG